MLVGLPLPESIWLEDKDEHGLTAYYPYPYVAEFTCGCGYKTTEREAVFKHLADEHGIEDLDEEVEFCYLAHVRDELPKDAKIVPYEEYE
jgi:hypothetical protein